jgi:hypothetical protein
VKLCVLSGMVCYSCIQLRPWSWWSPSSLLLGTPPPPDWWQRGKAAVRVQLQLLPQRALGQPSISYSALLLPVSRTISLVVKVAINAMQQPGEQCGAACMFRGAERTQCAQANAYCTFARQLQTRLSEYEVSPGAQTPPSSLRTFALFGDCWAHTGTTRARGHVRGRSSSEASQVVSVQ